MPDEVHKTSPEPVFAAERAHISKMREARGEGGRTDKGLSALCLSGGGIRSASFALGIMQALLNHDRLRRFDYLSTVSGGGYIGSALTWLLDRTPNATVVANDASGNFPLGVKDKGALLGGENAALNYIRQHGNYLSPGSGINVVSLFSVVLRSTVISLIVYFGLLSFFMFVIHNSELNEIVMLKKAIGYSRWIPAGEIYFIAALALLLIALAVYIAYAFGTFISHVTRWSAYGWRIRIQRSMGYLWVLVGILLVIASIPASVSLINELVSEAETALSTSERLDTDIRHLFAGALSTVLGLIGGYMRLSRSNAPTDGPPSTIVKVELWAIAILITYGLLLVSFASADKVGHGNWQLALGVFLLPSLTLGLLVSLNYLSLHRMYRDRLMETFMPAEQAIETNNWSPATDADRARLHEFCKETTPGPFHIVNTNVILADSRRNVYRGRGGDNFIFSPLYCGSTATGWVRTAEYMSGRVTLATAMAVSGAAANPNTGVHGQGVTRNRLVGFLMFLLNLRLGYWILNPRLGKRATWPGFPPTYLWPGLFQGLLGMGLHERRRYLQLSDGGHFDNLGLYEMVRRGVQLIVVSDGAADGSFKFGDLSSVVERIRVDFGADIRFNEADYDLMQMLPGTGEDPVMRGRFGTSRRGFAIGQIEYADGSRGTLIYIKLALTSGLPQDLYGYKSAHPAYPHEPTSDQFFDEVQFEAYRELGYRLGNQACADTEVRKVL